MEKSFQILFSHIEFLRKKFFGDLLWTFTNKPLPNDNSGLLALYKLKLRLKE